MMSSNGKKMPDFMNEAHERVCRVAVELMGDYLVWHTDRSRALLDMMPPLNVAALDTLIESIRHGARIPADFPGEYSLYLTEIVVGAIRIRDFDTRRERILAYRRCLREHDLLNRLRAAWSGENEEVCDATLEELRRLRLNREGGDALPVVCVAKAPDPPDPVFNNGPEPGGFGLIVGADGIGKGWLALDILLSATLGRPMNIPALQRRGMPLRALYLSYEDGAPALRRRLDRVVCAAGLTPGAWREVEASGGLTFSTGAPPLFVQSARGLPEPTRTLAALEERIRDQELGLCIIDPFASAALLQSENDNCAVNAVAIALRALASDTGCTVLLTHHTSKAGRDAAEHHAARGGSALTSAARWALRLLQKQDDPALLSVGVPKNSYGPCLEGVLLQRDDDGTLKQLSSAHLNQARERLLGEVVRVIAATPSWEINPNAIRLRNSRDACALISEVGASPREVFEAVQLALRRGLLATEERRRPSSGRRYCILTLPDATPAEESEEIPF